ncbi:hypothetical protein PQE66_gp144 [Bacillus phage PBC2]|uniref:Uncharacterized protein n=1 Tax=Bacillus phage PBC2 TaxID=1675029 RepID=A0A218KC28_9CAUD|nr:hypothetical protein PQE66_gp144 [Bacillus phage PBC2]AKQ08459.1 hypothetical protein PBC2_144 [Bacillus phage PBC2]
MGVVNKPTMTIKKSGTPTPRPRIQLPENNKAVLLNREARLFIYEQLSARKQQLVSDLDYYMKEGTTDDVLRVSSLINKIQEHMDKLL